MSTDTDTDTETRPPATGDARIPLTRTDKVRRTVTGVVVVAALAVLFFACQTNAVSDSEGNLETGDGTDLADITISGDGDAISERPPGGQTQADGAIPQGSVVARTFPADGASVVNQVQIGVEFQQGFTGTLRVNGTEIPEGQLRRRPELNQVFFQPGAGTVVPELGPGRNCAQAFAWEVNEDPSTGRATNWCFQVN